MEVNQKISRKASKPINIPDSNIKNIQNMYSEFEISSISSIPNGTPAPLTTNMLKYSNMPFKPNTPVESSPKLAVLYKEQYMNVYADISLISSKTLS